MPELVSTKADLECVCTNSYSFEIVKVICKGARKAESSEVFGEAPGSSATSRKPQCIETLSKVAVARVELLLPLTARPIYTPWAMVTVWVVPTCTQFTPSGEM